MSVAGMDVIGRDNWMIDVPVLQNIGLTRGGSMWSLVHTVSRTWARRCNAGTGLQ